MNSQLADQSSFGTCIVSTIYNLMKLNVRVNCGHLKAESNASDFVTILSSENSSFHFYSHTKAIYPTIDDACLFKYLKKSH